MLEAFDNMAKSGLISEEVRAEIDAAWKTKLQETREQVASELREEFATRYAHDQAQLVEALDRMVTDRLTVELTEFAQDQKELADQKAELAESMKTHGLVLENFVVKSLGRELAEFQRDRLQVQENFTKLEKFIVSALAREITEFSNDRKSLGEAKVRLVREGREELEKLKKEFVRRAAMRVESLVGDSLKREITQLREDIDQARNNDFGRRIYEAFAQEYSVSILNERSQAAKLARKVEEMGKELSEARQTLERQTKLTESARQDAKRVKDSAERSRVLGELLSPLGNSERTVMRSLLESCETSKLQKQFDHYLPAVLEGQTPQRRRVALKESQVEVSGDRKAPQPVAGDDTILDIRKLAGI